MKRLILAVIVLGSTSAHAANANSGCTMCDFPLPAEVMVEPKGDVCADLGYSVCTGQEGEFRYSKMVAQLETEMKANVAAAFDKAASAFGAANRDAYMLAAIQKTLRLRPDLSPASLAYLTNGDGWATPADFSAAAGECSARMAEINQYSYYSEQDPESLRAHITKLESAIQLNRANSIELYSIDALAFLRILGNRCQELATAQAQTGFKLPIDTNLAAQSLSRACSDTNSIRQSFLKVYRAQRNLTASPEMRQLVAGLIDAATFNVQNFANPQEYPSGQDVLSKLRNRYSKLLTSAACPSIDIYNHLRSTREAAMGKLVRSRVFVEAMIDKLYSPERHAKIERLFNEVKSEAKKVAARVVSDSLKLSMINARYDQLRLTWLNKPEARFYEKDPETGVELLSADIEFSDYALTSAFRKTGVDYFTVLNAFYVPQIKQGTIEIPTSVTIMPMFFLFAERNPFTLVGVLAHEVGHQIGPILSAINGFDLRTNYRPLLQCLAKPESISMQDHQADESIADFVSAEVVATMLNQLPEKKRRRAGIASVGDYCYFNVESIGNISLRTNGSHPNSLLRISGIFGGNSNFRKAIGCSAASPAFHTCDLEHTN